MLGRLFGNKKPRENKLVRKLIVDYLEQHIIKFGASANVRGIGEAASRDGIDAARRLILPDTWADIPGFPFYAVHFGRRALVCSAPYMERERLASGDIRELTAMAIAEALVIDRSAAIDMIRQATGQWSEYFLDETDELPGGTRRLQMIVEKAESDALIVVEAFRADANTINLSGHDFEQLSRLLGISASTEAVSRRDYFDRSDDRGGEGV